MSLEKRMVTIATMGLAGQLHLHNTKMTDETRFVFGDLLRNFVRDGLLDKGTLLTLSQQFGEGWYDSHIMDLTDELEKPIHKSASELPRAKDDDLHIGIHPDSVAGHFCGR